MKKEDLFEVLNDVDEAQIKEAGAYEKKIRPLWLKWGAAAAVLVVAVAAVLLWRGAGAAEGGSQSYEGVTVISAKTPEPVAKGMELAAYLESEEYGKWFRDYVEKFHAAAEVQGGMQAYYQQMMERLLPAEDENTVCSPLNTYLAVAMLAETAEGETRQQILDALRVPDIETLRTRVMALWQSNYIDTPSLQCTLGNSLWLNGSVTYNEDVLNRLAETYCASGYYGDPASEEMNQALRDWTDRNTGGLLKEYTKDLQLQPETVMALISTLYFRAAWTDEFYPQNTAPAVFHGTKGDTEAEMMHRSDSMHLYQTETFTAVSLNLNDSGAMTFYLPQEGVDVNKLLQDEALFSALAYDETDTNRYYRIVNLTIPKFKVSAKSDLTRTLADMGITDALDPARADFTALTADKPVWLSKAEHAAMVEIDENGVTGAAYTDLMLSGGAQPPEEIVDFVLDRPFLFTVNSRDGSILFAGIVRNIAD